MKKAATEIQVTQFEAGDSNLVEQIQQALPLFLLRLLQQVLLIIQ